MPSITKTEIEDRAKRGEVWLIVSGNSYNVTAWADYHPGGRLLLESLNGQDVTEPFLVNHSKSVCEEMLPRYLHGPVTDLPPTPPLRAGFLKMKGDMEREGLFDTSYLWYAQKIGQQLALFSLATYLYVVAESFGGYMLAAAALGFAWQQESFLGHDFGHTQVTHDFTLDYIGSWFVTATYGVSGQWWRRSHNIHHCITNSIEDDPDIQHLPIFAVTDAYFHNISSTYHRRIFEFDGLARILVGFQHILYLPVMAVARFNLYLQSLLLCLDPRYQVFKRKAELSALLAFWGMHYALIANLPTWQTRLGFLLVAHAVCGLIHVQITISHFAQETYHRHNKNIYRHEKDEFMPCQLAGTLNVDCPWWLDWFHGGLQFQIEHHLFPRLPRHNLRYVRDKYVKPFCKQHDLDYQEEPWLHCILRVLSCLQVTALKSRSFGNSASRSFVHSLLFAEG